MKELSMIKVIEELRKTRSLFHSEADFQFALAWKLKELYQDKVDIVLEVPLNVKSNDRLDILVITKSRKIPVELKYFHSKLDFNEYHLKKQNDTWRSQRVLKDLKRIEEFSERENKPNEQEGYVILICNESKYWTPKKGNLAYFNFRLEDGRTIKAKESLDWITMNDSSREKAEGYGDHLTFNNSYTLSWQEYSNIEGLNKGLFKYLLIEL